MSLRYITDIKDITLRKKKLVDLRKGVYTGSSKYAKELFELVSRELEKPEYKYSLY